MQLAHAMYLVLLCYSNHAWHNQEEAKQWGTKMPSSKKKGNPLK
jgi:hypothetical protein